VQEVELLLFGEHQEVPDYYVEELGGEGIASDPVWMKAGDNVDGGGDEVHQGDPDLRMQATTSRTTTLMHKRMFLAG
jgi:hypothetical protein